MKASVEISMYPLDAEYGTAILKFIQGLRAHEGLLVQANTMSTQVFGEYDLVMSALGQEMKAAFAEGRATAMVLKLVNLDLRP